VKKIIYISLNLQTNIHSLNSAEIELRISNNESIFMFGSSLGVNAL
jgi:hypothetical protein